MEELVEGLCHAEPSIEVYQRTQGLFPIVYMGVYCRDFKGDAITIGRTMVKLAENMGWTSAAPRQGLSVVVLGDQQFCEVASTLARRFGMPFSVMRLPYDNDLAFEMLDSQFKQLTHFVEFCSVKTVANDMYSNLIFNYGISHLKIVFP